MESTFCYLCKLRQILNLTSLNFFNWKMELFNICLWKLNEMLPETSFAWGSSTSVSYLKIFFID